MIEHFLVDTCYKVSVSRNEYGDNIASTITELLCRFRDISGYARGAYGEVLESDAMIWFAPDTEIDKGDIVKYESEYFQIKKITKAKRAGSTTVQFLKCDLKLIDLAFS